MQILITHSMVRAKKKAARISLLEVLPIFTLRYLCTVVLGAILLFGSTIIGCDAPRSDNPFAGKRLYVDPDSDAKKQADEWRSSRPEDARQIDKIASQPRSFWFGDNSPRQARSNVEEVVDRVTGAGALPVLVVYNIPGRDCGNYSAGGADSAEEYRDWVRAFAEGIGDRKAIVLLEPDALGDLTTCFSSARQQERLDLLEDAVAVLEAKPGVSVYLDGGYPGWHPPQTMADRLNAAGILEARGFFLNVSNFVRTSENVDYGKQVSNLTGGKPFVIDTSRNGLGAAEQSDPEWWCNPEGRALGARPTTDTGDPLVEAYLWVKPPGESDGTCHDGPSSGQWWPEYALGLAQRAAR